MKKTILFLSLVLSIMFVSSTFAQSSKYGWLAKESWAFGFGGMYPYGMNQNYKYTETNYGGFISIQRNYSEHVGIRLKPHFFSLKGKLGTTEVTANTIGGNLDLLYYFVPCEPLSPYINVGFGFLYSMFDNQTPVTLPTSNADWQMNLGFGAEYMLGENWKLTMELDYHTVSNASQFGVQGVNEGGLLGSPKDAYMNFDLGFLYYFGYGEKSNLCQLYEGVNAIIDYAKIEDIVKKYAAESTDNIDYDRIEDIVKKYKSVAIAGEQNWVLIGVNFDFDKASLKSESFPILYHAAEILLTHPDVNVEIQGHTDNVGSDNYNQKLSLERAVSVKNFLVSKGVSASRITTVGMGESKPISDNKTEDGRMLNRRIEFKVK